MKVKTIDHILLILIKGASPGPAPGPGPSPSGSTVQFTTYNNCPYTIWVGTFGNSKSNPGAQRPFNGGYQLNSKTTISFNVPKGNSFNKIK